MHRVFKRSPFALQKGSFRSAKGVLLGCKSSPFALQKGYICESKVLHQPVRAVLQLTALYSQSVHERVAQYLLTEIAAFERLHGEERDALVLVVDIAQGVAQGVPQRSVFGIGYCHDAVYVLVVDYRLEYVEEEVVVLHHLLYGIRTDDELAQRVLEGACVEVVLVRAGGEVVERGLVLGVYEYHLCLAVGVALLAHSAVESHAVNPSCGVGLGYASAEHALEVDYKIESHRVDVVAVDEYHVAAPLCIVEFLYVHVLIFAELRCACRTCSGTVHALYKVKKKLRDYWF